MDGVHKFCNNNGCKIIYLCQEFCVSNMQNPKRLKSLPKPEELKTYIINAKEPFIIHNVLNSWDILSWSLDDWTRQIGDKKLPFRTGSFICTQEPQWEHKCDVSEFTMKEFVHITSQEDYPKKECSKWMYFDYKRLENCFDPQPEFVQKISWADFGFPEKTGEHSTIWIGSKGAHTTCHMDTYGCNIVAQVYGRKMWLLFPPKCTEILKPTRVPYEESSIYSRINFKCGRSDFSDITEAHMTELCPGDVLIVPKHWWHYVENWSAAISINLWLPLESDDESRLEESLVRYFVASVVSNISENEKHAVLNPNEADLCDSVIGLQQIDWCVQHCSKQADCSTDTSESGIKDLLSLMCDTYSHMISSPLVMDNKELKGILLESCECDDDDDSCNSAEVSPSTMDSHITIDHVINAFCHPNVISEVQKLILKQIRK